MKTSELRPGAYYWYTSRVGRERVRYLYRRADGCFMFDSDDWQSISMTAERVEERIREDETWRQTN